MTKLLHYIVINFNPTSAIIIISNNGAKL